MIVFYQICLSGCIHHCARMQSCYLIRTVQMPTVQQEMVTIGSSVGLSTRDGLEKKFICGTCHEIHFLVFDIEVKLLIDFLLNFHCKISIFS